MFRVEFLKNDKNNEWLIRQFEIFKLRDTILTEKFIPRPDISIIFHLKNTPLIFENKEIHIDPFLIAPIIPKSLFITFQGTMDTFVVICKPTVLSRIFSLDLSPISQYSTSLPHNVFYPVWKNLSQQEVTEERICCFTKFINSIQKTEYIPDAIDLFYEKIIETGGTFLLKDIMQECSVCQRTIERNFIKRAGVSPKMLMRIVRLDYLWTKIQDEKAIDYQDMVFDGNYFDQAHFIKDFRSIIGESPSYFFKKNQKIVKMVSGRIEGKE